MWDFGRRITGAAIAFSLCAAPTAAIGAPPAAAPVNPWLALSAMTTSSSAATVAAAQGDDDGRGVPILPLAVILATIGVAVYILVKDDEHHGTPISPF
jgi:hypothetical protein